MNLFRPILGLGFLAGAAYAAVKLVEMFDKENDIEWTAMMGEMPEEEYTVPAPKMNSADDAPEAAPETPAEPEAAPEQSEAPAGETAPVCEEAPAGKPRRAPSRRPRSPNA